jgi:hypothetical protein
MSRRLYVLVREDLEQSYRMVQGGHAIAEWTLKYPERWSNETLVMLKVKDESKIEDFHERLSFRGIEHVVFKEPDINYESTALAVMADDKLFKNLRLA